MPAEKQPVELGSLRADALYKILEPIIGLPLVDLWHPFSQVFEFGPTHYFLNRKGERVSRGLWVIDIQCNWAVTQGPTVVLGSHDAVGKRRFYHRKTPPRDPESRRRWEAALRFFDEVHQQALTVTAIEMEETGFLRIRLSEGYTIHVFEIRSTDEDLWFFFNSLTGVKHWVESKAGALEVTRFENDPDVVV